MLKMIITSPFAEKEFYTRATVQYIYTQRYEFENYIKTKQLRISLFCAAVPYTYDRPNICCAACFLTCLLIRASIRLSSSSAIFSLILRYAG